MNDVRGRGDDVRPPQVNPDAGATESAPVPGGPAEIVRATRSGGRLALFDASPTPGCATCPADARNPNPVGLMVIVPGGPTLHTGLCVDCLAEALAILFGRRHVQDGGQVGELNSTAVECEHRDDDLEQVSTHEWQCRCGHVLTRRALVERQRGHDASRGAAAPADATHRPRED